MSSREKPILIYTLGDIDVPSEKVSSQDLAPETQYVSAYTGKVLPKKPTMGTATDDPTGKNTTYHGGIVYPGKDQVQCHEHVESPQDLMGSCTYGQ